MSKSKDSTILVVLAVVAVLVLLMNKGFFQTASVVPQYKYSFTWKGYNFECVDNSYTGENIALGFGDSDFSDGTIGLYSDDPYKTYTSPDKYTRYSSAIIQITPATELTIRSDTLQDYGYGITNIMICSITNINLANATKIEIPQTTYITMSGLFENGVGGSYLNIGTLQRGVQAETQGSGSTFQTSMYKTTCTKLSGSWICQDVMGEQIGTMDKLYFRYAAQIKPYGQVGTSSIKTVITDIRVYQDQSAIISELQGTLAEQIEYIKNLNATIQQKAELIKSLELTAAQQAQIITALDLNIAEQAVMIETLSDKVSEQSELINQLTTNLETKAALVNALTVENVRQAELIKEMKLSFANQGLILDALDKTVQDDAVIISKLTTNIDEQAQIINSLMASQAEKEKLIADLKATIAAQQAALDQKTTTPFDWKPFAIIGGIVLAVVLLFRR